MMASDEIKRLAEVVGASVGVAGEEILGLALSVATRRPDWYRSGDEQRAAIAEILRSLRVSLLGPRVSPEARPGVPRDEVMPSPAIPHDPAGTIGNRQWRGVTVNSTFRHAVGCPWRVEGWPTAIDGAIVPCICGVTSAHERGPSAKVPGASDVRWLILAAIERQWAVLERKRLRTEADRLPKKTRNDIRRAAKMTGLDRAKLIGRVVKAHPTATAVIMVALAVEQEKLSKVKQSDPPEDWTTLKVRAWGTIRDLRRLRTK